MTAVTAPLILLLGGARSGKSALAVRWARTFAGPVTVVVTADAGDDEMRARITRHRAERPADWTTVGARSDPAGAVATADDDALVVVDCLTLWVANVMDVADDDAVVRSATALAAAAADRTTPTIVVSNEVGLGIVPADPVTRRYRDLLGSVNAAVAARADRTLLLVAGRALRLERAPADPTELF